MANEITVSCALTAAKGNWSLAAFQKLSQRFTLNGTRALEYVQTIGTSEEALQLGELASLGYCMVLNLDTTNFAHIKTGTGGVNVIKLKPGEVCLFRFGSGITAPFAIADTAPVQIQIRILED